MKTILVNIKNVSLVSLSNNQTYLMDSDELTYFLTTRKIPDSCEELMFKDAPLGRESYGCHPEIRDFSADEYNLV